LYFLLHSAPEEIRSFSAAPMISVIFMAVKSFRRFIPVGKRPFYKDAKILRAFACTGSCEEAAVLAENPII